MDPPNGIADICAFKAFNVMFTGMPVSVFQKKSVLIL